MLRRVKVFYVAGMHRSGTSASARVLNLAGVSLGGDGALMAPGADNERGFWESAAVSRFNDRLLASLGGAWDRPPVLAPGWEDDPALDAWRATARQILDGLTADSPDAFGVKDPRFSVLLPFWTQLLPATAVIHPLRDPRAVAASLAKRNGMGEVQSVQLWLRYVAGTCTLAPDAVVLTYEDLLEDPPGQLTALASRLGLPAPTDEALATATEFLSAELDHSASEPHEPAPMMALAQDLYGRLRAGDSSAQELAQGVLGLIEESGRQQNAGAPADSQVLSLGARLQQLERDLDDERARHRETRTTAQESHARVTRARAELAQARENLRRVREDLRQVRANLRKAREKGAATRERLAAVRQERDALEARLQGSLGRRVGARARRLVGGLQRRAR